MKDSIKEYVKRFRQEVTPAMRCYHPLRIYNYSRGEFEWHNCGKCPYCLKMRSDELTQRCYSESEQHPFAIFFTLTYDNEHIPYLEKLVNGGFFATAKKLSMVKVLLSFTILRYKVFTL